MHNLSLPHRNTALTGIIREAKASQKLSDALASHLLNQQESLGEKVEFPSERNISNPKDFKKLAKEIGIGWTVLFRYGKRERKGQILSKNSRGLVCSVSFIGSDNKIKTERTTVKCNQIIEIFKNRL